MRKSLFSLTGRQERFVGEKSAEMGISKSEYIRRLLDEKIELVPEYQSRGKLDAGEGVFSSAEFKENDLVTEDRVNEVVDKYTMDKLKASAVTKAREYGLGEFLMDLFSGVEKQGKRVGDVVIDTDVFVLMRKSSIPYFAYCHRRSFVERGYVGSLWGADVWLSRKTDKVYCFSEGSTLLRRRFPEIAAAKEDLKLFREF